MDLRMDYIRSQFPALEGDWVYFDNAGGSQVAAPVVERIREYLLSSPVQLGATYQISQLAGLRVTEAAEAMARYINAASATEVIMGSSTSMLLRVLSICLGRTLSPGDEVIVTNCDHEANIGPWVDLAGITVKTWRLNPDSLELHLEDLQALLTERTRLVAVTHTSNVLGTINPIKEIARVVHEAGAMICVDGVAYAPHRAIDVRELDVDFYALSFYKVYGPHYALLYGKSAHLLEIPGINHFFIGQSDIPYKFQPGNVNYEQSYGMLGLWDYLGGFAAAHGRNELEDRSRAQVEFAFEAFAAHEELLAGRLLEFLATRSNVRVMGRTEADRRQRVPTISFVVDGVQSDSITAAVDEHEIGIRYGDFYARRLIDDLGLSPGNGVVRVSMVHYNTLEEVDRLTEILDKLF
jgi:cysteine desulfurase family protein (TIGR01976 family)